MGGGVTVVRIVYVPAAGTAKLTQPWAVPLQLPCWSGQPAAAATLPPGPEGVVTVIDPPLPLTT